jgi:hypothetical protein
MDMTRNLIIYTSLLQNPSIYHRDNKTHINNTRWYFRWNFNQVKILLKFKEKCTAARGQDGIVSIATGYRLDDRGIRVRVPVGSKIVSSPCHQTGSGVHPTFCPMGTWGSFPEGKAAGAWKFFLLHVIRSALGSTQPSVQRVPRALFPGVKRPGRETDHSPPTSAEVKEMWIYTFTLPL